MRKLINFKHCYLILVRMAGEKYHKNRSVCAKSMTFGTLIVLVMPNKMRGSAKLNYHFLSNGGQATCLP